MLKKTKEKTVNINRILVVDDDENIGNLIEEILVREGYLVTRAYSGSEALLMVEKEKPNLIILDLMLPGVTGERVMEKIVNIPVIVLSAKISVEDKVNLLSLGANDYMTKPFEIKELLARVAVQLRIKPTKMEQNKLYFQDISLDCEGKIVKVKESEIHLTKTEFAILEILMRNSKIVVTKSKLLDLLSLENIEIYDNSLKVHISHLRTKLKEKSNHDYIDAVWGVGFKLNNK